MILVQAKKNVLTDNSETYDVHIVDGYNDRVKFNCASRSEAEWLASRLYTSLRISNQTVVLGETK